MTRLERLWPLIIVLSTIGVGITTFANVQSPARVLLTVWFLGVCPGMAMVRLMRLGSRLMEWALAVALSVSLDTIVGSVLIYSHLWSPDAGLIAIMIICVLAVSLQLEGGPTTALTERNGA